MSLLNRKVKYIPNKYLGKNNVSRDGMLIDIVSHGGSLVGIIIDAETNKYENVYISSIFDTLNKNTNNGGRADYASFSKQNN